MAGSSESTTGVGRSGIVAFGLIAVWTVIVLRLISVQAFSNVASERMARRQRTFVETLPARPGDIRDREGRLLATSIRRESLAIDPSTIEAPWDVSEQLAAAVGIDPRPLATRIVAAADKRFLWVKRRLTDDEADAVAALGLPPEVWHFRGEFERIYPQGAVASHVLGTRDVDNRGRGGVEEGLEPILLGTDGRRTLIRDARGFVIDVDALSTIEPQHGCDVTLTVDSILQAAVEKQLDGLMEECRPLAACAIVLDPRTGEVLAMVSRPQCPVVNGPESDKANLAELTTADGSPSNPPPVEPDLAAGWRNHAIASMFEPGSTFKPFIVGQAIDAGRIQNDEEFDCEFGAYRMGRRVLHDHHSYGKLSVTDILVKSSNIGMAKIGERLENPGLFEAATIFGFGRRTGIELPGEIPGQLHPLEDWTSYSTGSIPMGQEIAATPLQMIAAHAALANAGTYCSPHLLLRSGANNPPTVLSRQVLTPATARWLVQGPMVEVITRGTGKKAMLKEYTVFGKSGTAQKIDDHGGYSHTRHVGSFVCGAPAEAPQAIVLVSVDEPTQGPSHYGGVVAAPTAAAILQLTLEHLGVPPTATSLSARQKQ
jgi:cell division protein FtsI/penicillin-binding protein 2